MKTYYGRRQGSYPLVTVHPENGDVRDHRTISPELPIEDSLRLKFISPAGFEWGCDCDGAEQLALALLFDVTGDRKRSLGFYKTFKWLFVVQCHDEWLLSEQEVINWLECKEGSQTALKNAALSLKGGAL